MMSISYKLFYVALSQLNFSQYLSIPTAQINSKIDIEIGENT